MTAKDGFDAANDGEPELFRLRHHSTDRLDESAVIAENGALSIAATLARIGGPGRDYRILRPPPLQNSQNPTVAIPRRTPVTISGMPMLLNIFASSTTRARPTTTSVIASLPSGASPTFAHF
jgi:hypothetical protein